MLGRPNLKLSEKTKGKIENCQEMTILTILKIVRLSKNCQGKQETFSTFVLLVNNFQQ